MKFPPGVYGSTDGLAISSSLPGVLARYMGRYSVTIRQTDLEDSGNIGLALPLIPDGTWPRWNPKRTRARCPRSPSTPHLRPPNAWRRKSCCARLPTKPATREDTSVWRSACSPSGSGSPTYSTSGGRARSSRRSRSPPAHGVPRRQCDRRIARRLRPDALKHEVSLFRSDGHWLVWWSGCEGWLVVDSGGSRGCCAAGAR